MASVVFAVFFANNYACLVEHKEHPQGGSSLAMASAVTPCK
jgi:hypothetical protein